MSFIAENRFIVEDGTGLADATSYATVEDADDYLVVNPHAWSAWADLPASAKEYLLRWATRELDQRARWQGRKTVANSALAWPRAFVPGTECRFLASDAVPLQVKQATIEMARLLLDRDPGTDRGQDGLKELEVDVIKLVFDESYRLPEVPRSVIYLLRGLVVSFSNGTKTQSATIVRA
ncbi:hypothetical protein FHS85_001882 [Rhodoligotrophos appendicifer]|uniref:DnaT-like ssDNA-binding protein n=1 Tax=Rhodoligotrophos appendicifer TaxID=987056 RepID=UPI0011867D6C|nr:DnaT-like ssDNA-binding protein [Rhodoligotrophos appendicifer]